MLETKAGVRCEIREFATQLRSDGRAMRGRGLRCSTLSMCNIAEYSVTDGMGAQCTPVAPAVVRRSWVNRRRSLSQPFRGRPSLLTAVGADCSPPFRTAASD